MKDENWFVNNEITQYKLNGFRYFGGEDCRTKLLIQGLCCESKIIWSDFVHEFLKKDLKSNIISFDSRGVGKSDGKVVSFSQIVQDTIQIVRMENSSIQLIGHSLGGMVALKVAEEVPELISSVVLICSNPSYTLKNRSGFLWRADEIEKNKDINCIFKKVIPRSFAEKFISTHPDVIAKFTQMLGRQDIKNYCTLSRIAAEVDAVASFDNISCPIMFVVGDQDKSITIEKTHEFSLRKESLVKVIYGSGHNVPLENPEILSNFIYQFDCSLEKELQR